MERDAACTVHVCEEGHCTCVLKYQAGSVESRMVPWTVECTSGSLDVQCNAVTHRPHQAYRNHCVPDNACEE